jgi:hypothetical protein
MKAIKICWSGSCSAPSYEIRDFVRLLKPFELFISSMINSLVRVLRELVYSAIKRRESIKVGWDQYGVSRQR